MSIQNWRIRLDVVSAAEKLNTGMSDGSSDPPCTKQCTDVLVPPRSIWSGGRRRGRQGSIYGQIVAGRLVPVNIAAFKKRNIPEFGSAAESQKQHIDLSAQATSMCCNLGTAPCDVAA